MTIELKQEDIQNQISCVTHEIRNHLSICDMYSQIIKKNLEKSGIDNTSIENAVECIQKSIQIIGSTLLDLKSLNSSTEQITDFEKTILKAVELSRAYVVDKDIDFDIFIKNSANIKTDENRFLACLVNIIKNGLESIEIKGKIEVIAAAEGNYGIIKISNNGKPIPKDKQKDIFNQGFTTKQHGCGLGLAICKKFLESQNATIKLVKSTKGQTTFEIRIPIEK